MILASDEIVEVGRLVLFGVMAFTAYRLHPLYKQTPDRNWVPWFCAGVVHAAYAVFVALLIVGSQVTVEEWWRLAFTALNALAAATMLWVVDRTVRMVVLAIGHRR